MTIFFTISFFLLVILALWRKKHIDLATVRYKNKLFTLRDKLRRYEIEGKLGGDDQWVFDYLDKSISKLIKQSYYITFFYIFISNVKHEENESLTAFGAKLGKAIDGNHALKNIVDTLVSDTLFFIRDQHTVTYLIVKVIANPIIGLNGLIRRMNGWVNNIIVLPETSMSGSYIS
ncbi:hypothetical protein N9R81_01775 [Flavobacteriales bacterium]|nr:hypothetical protein [Flavobacteriales bacterium]